MNTPVLTTEKRRNVDAGSRLSRLSLPLRNKILARRARTPLAASDR